MFVTPVTGDFAATVSASEKCHQVFLSMPLQLRPISFHAMVSSMHVLLVFTVVQTSALNFAGGAVQDAHVLLRVETSAKPSSSKAFMSGLNRGGMAGANGGAKDSERMAMLSMALECVWTVQSSGPEMSDFVPD